MAKPTRLPVARGFLVLGAALALAGCGGADGRLPTRPVSGKVTLDGTPVANAEVWLVPTSENVKNAKMTVRPHAKSGADGTFTLTSYVTDDGAPVGEYGVMVQKAGGGADETEDDPETPQPKKGKGRTFAETVASLQRSKFPTKYGNPTTSGLTFTVTDGPNQLDLPLKSK